ncbi:MULTISPECIES: rod shape-determining protein MreD [unclassified Jeotgalibaca]|uniref:rod shape-determining protein MreD n=1 Tax=unclassified Jeotgalibaca TaxID=2621505 RepID=UPI003FD6BE02
MVQNRTLNHVYLIPILLFLGLVMDGIVMNIFSASFLDQNYVLVPRILLLLFVVFTLLFPKQPLFLYALLFGIMYDSYYTGILGIYVTAIASCIYLVKRSQRFLTTAPVAVFIVYFLSISYVEIFVFGVYSLLGMADLSFGTFIATRLGPTVLLNFFFLALLYVPLLKLSKWMYSV